MSQALITLDRVGWARDGNTILSDVSFNISSREIVTIIGPNGAGKSSLIKIAIGLVPPGSGSVHRAKGVRIGYMPQHLRFDNSLPISVERFIKLSGTDRKALAHYGEMLGVDCLLKSQLQDLSGGEMQRVLLTRAVLRTPHLLVLDEPTQGVDVVGQAELYRHISRLRDELGCAVLMVSHDLHLVMAQTDTVICLNHHICCHGKPESVTQHPEYLQLFGEQAAKDIAVYTHDHDHEHNLHGEVIDDEHSECKHH